MKLLVVGSLIVSCFVGAVLSIECYSCWPPMNQEACKRSSARIDCWDIKNIGYDRCIEVRYHGNKSLARTCYPSYKCDEAKEWCRRYGPCTVKCCDYNMCNPASSFKAVGVLYIVMPLFTMAHYFL